MPFIDVNLKDAKESEVIPEGNYDLRIVKAVDKDSKKGNPITQCTIAIESSEYPTAMPITHVINHINDKTPEEQKGMRLRDTRRFLELFSVPFEGNGFDTDDLEGATAEAFVSQETGTDGVLRNKITLPPFKDEEEQAPRGKRRAAGGRRR